MSLRNLETFSTRKEKGSRQAGGLKFQVWFLNDMRKIYGYLSNIFGGQFASSSWPLASLSSNLPSPVKYPLSSGEEEWGAWSVSEPWADLELCWIWMCTVWWLSSIPASSVLSSGILQSLCFASISNLHKRFPSNQLSHQHSYWWSPFIPIIHTGPTAYFCTQCLESYIEKGLKKKKRKGADDYYSFSWCTVSFQWKLFCRMKGHSLNIQGKVNYSQSNYIFLKVSTTHIYHFTHHLVCLSESTGE